jgi:hypothetical protein
MRKIFLLPALLIFFAACNNDPKQNLETKKVVLSTDTTVKSTTGFSADTAVTVQKQVIPPAVVKPTVIYRQAKPAPVIVQRRNTAIQQRRPARTVTPATPDEINTSSSLPTPDNTNQPTSGTDNNGTNPNNGTNNGTTSGTPQPQAKKGWDNATKGAVIGGAGGAIGGAIISKKKGKGAIIGGIVGAAGGYILGRKKDKASQDSTR